MSLCSKLKLQFYFAGRVVFFIGLQKCEWRCDILYLCMHVFVCVLEILIE